DARLHIAPPAVIAAAETHEMRPAGMVAGKPYRLHHRLGTGHMERYLVKARNPSQSPHIVGNNRMVSAEHRTKLADEFRAVFQTLFIEVVAQKVDAVGAREVVERVFVEVSHRDAGGRLQEPAAAQVVPNETAVLERYAVGIGELQVGNAIGHLGGLL